MGKRDPRVDAYIKKAAPFAQPILTEIRETVHASCPDVEEAMKWSFPHFVYKGMLCSMASFKEHAALGFWKGSLVTGGPRGVDAMGHFGRLTKRSDLPSKTRARRLRQEGGGAERAGREGAARAEEGGAEDGEGAGRSLRRVQEEQEGAGRLRRVEPEPQARVHRVDHRGQGATRRGRGGSRRRSSGWPRASRGTGSMREGA